MSDDLLRETPIYQIIAQEGYEEGVENIRRKGVAAHYEHILLRIILRKFPELIAFAKKQVAPIMDSRQLSDLIVRMSIVQASEEAIMFLVNINEQEQ